MTRSYSLDLRVRVIAFVEGGHSRRAAARHFGVSDSFAIKLLHRQTRLGSPAPARQGRPRGTGKLAPYEEFLVQVVEAKPDITMPELAARLLEKHGVTVVPATLSRLFCRRGFTYKIYGPAVRRKRLLQVGRETVRINLSGLVVEHLLRATMEIRAHRACLKPRPHRAIFIPRLPVRRATVRPSCHILLANLGRTSVAVTGSGCGGDKLRLVPALAGQHAPSNAGELVG